MKTIMSNIFASASFAWSSDFSKSFAKSCAHKSNQQLGEKHID